MPSKLENIKASAAGDKITVKYTVHGLNFNQSLNISLYYSTDKGQTFTGPVTAVTGDVGKDIRNGNHQITWDALKEVPFTKQDLVFDVRGELVEAKNRKIIVCVLCWQHHNLHGFARRHDW